MNSERVQLRTDSLDDDNYGDDHESRDSLNIQSPRGRRGHSHTRIPLSDSSYGIPLRFLYIPFDIS